MFKHGIFNKTPQVTSANVPYVAAASDIDETATLLETLVSVEEDFISIIESSNLATVIYSEDGDIEILQEGFKDMVTSAVEFFKKMINSLIEFVKRFFTWLSSYIGNFEKFVEKNKKRLTSLNPDFSFEGYVYTIKAGVPNLDRVSAIITDFNKDLSSLDKMSMEDLTIEREETTSTNVMNALRGSVLGASQPIESEDYLNEVKKSYRNDEDKPTSIKVNGQYLTGLVNTYSDLAKLKTEVSKERDKVNVLLSNMRSFFEKGPKTGFEGNEGFARGSNITIKNDGYSLSKSDDVTVKGDSIQKMNFFYSTKFKQAKEIGAIVLTALNEKVSAIKENLKQNERVIRKAAFSKDKETPKED